MKKAMLIFINCCLLHVFCFPQQTSYKFDFGGGKVEKGYTQVLPTTLYNAQRGYGFEFSSNLQSKNYNSNNALLADYITSNQPFYFSAKLPEGNYNVKVILGDKDGTSAATIKAECRRLMVEKVETQKGKFATVEFTVHVKDSLIRDAQGNVVSKVKLKPRERSYLHWDDKLTLEFNNTDPKVCAVEIAPDTGATTVFIAGNSTVVDQANEPYAAWGQMLPSFFQPEKISIANYAESGETLIAFKGERRLEKVFSMAKPGDYLFIEFAHNDQKPGGNHLDPFTTYSQTLKGWISECRKRNITPVLVTSMHRRRFDSTADTVINTLEDYPAAMRQVAKQENVTLLDLNAMSKTLYEAWGPAYSVKAFVHYPANTFPNQPAELKDDTHFNTYGAYELAKCIIEAIKKSDLPLKNFIVDGFKGFDPAKPDKFEAVYLPVSPPGKIIKPDGN
ncbi:rhamnogalacturonan acetylesterase [Parafilimonas sp.]|uniref:rhamnogalacturonan acetylesterase n=1 Tax=Parafilimonas sp. TaxID=1969739 RepID=UPI0039E45463